MNKYGIPEISNVIMKTLENDRSNWETKAEYWAGHVNAAIRSAQSIGQFNAAVRFGSQVHNEFDFERLAEEYRKQGYTASIGVYNDTSDQILISWPTTLENRK